MKYNNLHLIIALLGAALVFSTCTLDEEPAIPTGASNEKAPVFGPTVILPNSNVDFKATARLDSMGSLKIVQHGWVWSGVPNPTILDDKIELGSLTANIFATSISGLDIGKLYYFRPFLQTGSGLIYGPEECSFLGVDFEINTDQRLFKGALVQFTNHSVGNNTYLWDFGDGSTSTAYSPVHGFEQLGTAKVVLTVENNGCRVSKSLTLLVEPDPFKDYWVPIPRGTFEMGCSAQLEPCDGWDSSNNELPLHLVTVDSFLLGQTEVTQKQWEAVMGKNPSIWPDCGPDCPVENISWETIVYEFLPALSRKTGRTYRLPSEAEWEYAARGGENYRYAGSDSLDLVGWYWDNTKVDTSRLPQPHPVKGKMANAFNLFDMTGNLREWVEDDYHDNYNLAPSTGLPWIDNPRSDLRIARGGDWGTSPHNCRLSLRRPGRTYDRGDALGFRLARSY